VNLKKKKTFQSVSILGILDEQKQQQQHTLSLTQENEITPSNSHPFTNQQQSSDSFFNLSLSTIFSTRLEEDTDRKMQDIYETVDENNDEEKDNANTDLSQEKPRRPHPFPFTSPSYLKSLEKNQVNNPNKEITTKRNRKRTRSKKMKRLVKVKSYRFAANLNIGLKLMRRKKITCNSP